jgi:hypothetical protein
MVVYNDFMEKVKCVQLWREWMESSPNDEKVIDCKESLSKFSKEDWSNMTEEAVHLVDSLAYLVINNVPLKDKISEDCFDLFIKHIDDWFFVTDKRFISNMIASCMYDDNFFKFFDGFHPGLNQRLIKLMMAYFHKLPD